MMHQWFVWPGRVWGKYRVARLGYTNFAGSGYCYARDDRGRIVSFWRKRNAEAYAGTLNAKGARP